MTLSQPDSERGKALLGRSNYVTLVANYIPLQDSYGGPNYFQLDANGLYEIHIDNTGDAIEDLTFQFKFTNTPKGFPLTIGPVGNQRTNDVPVLAAASSRGRRN